MFGPRGFIFFCVHDTETLVFVCVRVSEIERDSEKLHLKDQRFADFAAERHQSL